MKNSQDAKIKVSLDDQVSSTARVIGKNIQGISGGAVSVIVDGFVKILSAGTEASGKLVEKFGDLNKALIGMEEERTGVIAEQLEEQDKAFKKHFESIVEGFSEFSEQLISGSGKLIGGISKFPEAFEGGFATSLNKIVNDSGDSFQQISKFGETTATNLNSSFKTFFVAKFKGDTASLGDLFKSFADTMKNNFINSLADMAASFATSKVFDLLKGGTGLLGFSQGGLIPAGEDGMFLGRSGEGILTPDGVTKVGGKAGMEALNRPGAPGTDFIGPPTASQNFLNEVAELRNATTFETSLDLSNPSTVTAKNVGGSIANAGLNIGAGIAGSELAGAFVPASKEASIGSAVGGAIGSAAGPLGAFAGAFFGGLVGSIFGGERLSKTEREFGALFKQFRPNFDDPFSALAFTRLKQPGTGADNVADALNNIVGRDLFPGTSFLRDNAGPEGVNALTVKGFNNLIELGKLDRERIIDGLVQDLVFFKGKFASGLNFVPHDDFPAFLHRGERVLTQSENRIFSQPSFAIIEVLEEIKEISLARLREERKNGGKLDRVVDSMEDSKLEIKVVTVDLDEITEHVFKVFDRKVRDRQITIDAAVII